MLLNIKELSLKLGKQIFSLGALPYAFIFLVVVYQTRTTQDTLWSIRLGQDLFDGKNIWIERWSWTANGDWYANHEWLFEVFVYVAYKLGGNTFVLFYGLQGLLAAVSFYLLKNSVKNNDNTANSVSVSLGYVFSAIALFIIADLFWEVRAQSFTLLFMALCLYLIAKEKYYYIPLVILFWANFHGGFIIGCYMIFGAFLIAAFSYARDRNDLSLQRAKKIFIVGVLSFAATFLTPLHWRNWSYIFDRSQDSQAQAIIEFTPTLDSPKATLQLAALILFYVFSVYLVKKDFSRWSTKLAIMLPALFLPLTLVAIRFIPPFFFLIIPIIFLATLTLPPKIAHVRTKVDLLLADRKIYVGAFAGFTVILTLLISGAISWINYTEDTIQKPSPGFSETLRDSCSDGLIYNDYASAGSILFWEQDVLLFIDNRYDPYSEEVRSYLDLSNPEWEEYLIGQNVSCAVVKNVEKEQSSAGELTKADWPLVYGDPFVRIYDNPYHKADNKTMFSEEGIMK